MSEYRCKICKKWYEEVIKICPECFEKDVKNKDMEK